MKYLLLVYGEESAWTEEEREACMEESRRLCHELSEEGRFLDASPLHPVVTATSVRVRQGKAMVTDGPFAETREQLGGYYLIEAENLDQAIAIASRVPAAQKGTVEVRPLIELAEMPARETVMLADA